MSALDTPLRNAASILIGRFGALVTVTTNEQRKYDPTKGGPDGTYDEEFPLRAIVEHHEQKTLATERAGGGGGRGRKLTIADQDLEGREPTKNWVVTIGEKKYRMAKEPKAVYSGDEVAMWELVVRR